MYWLINYTFIYNPLLKCLKYMLKFNQMRGNNFLVKMFTAHSGLSSKRVCGFIGWLTCLFVCVWCTMYNTQAPEVSDWLFICSTSLLGLDSITGVFKKKSDKVFDKVVEKEEEKEKGCKREEV